MCIRDRSGALARRSLRARAPRGADARPRRRPRRARRTPPGRQPRGRAGVGRGAEPVEAHR
eukprot:2836490-Alexandrium_andersonii.AAC.1